MGDAMDVNATAEKKSPTWWEFKKRFQNSDTESVSSFWDNVKSIFWAVLIAFVIRSFLVEPFKIPSSSMVPTLKVGDYIFVNKFHYGLRVPWTKAWPVHGSLPARGEVIVFIWPVDEKLDFIKRVIGLPGDKIRVVGHDMYVNGEMLAHEPVPAPTDDDDANEYDYYREVIGDHTHLVRYEKNYAHPERSFTVKDDQIFVMGDNRDNSQDSREWGGVPFKNFKGKAMITWLSRDYTVSWFNPHAVRWNRFGRAIE